MSSVTHAAGADLEVGDVVVSPRHGPGKITDRGVRTVAEARDEYLTVALERRGITLMIPVRALPAPGFADWHRGRRLGRPLECWKHRRDHLIANGETASGMPRNGSARVTCLILPRWFETSLTPLE